VELSDFDTNDDYHAAGLWLAFAVAVRRDHGRHITDVVNEYQQQPERRDYLDRMLIALCSLSLPALLEQIPTSLRNPEKEP
jgi:hypothetical protein